MVIRRNAVMAKLPLATCVAIGLFAVPGLAGAKVAGRPGAPAAAPAPMTRSDLVAKLHSIFQSLDTNKDGYVSQQEMAAGLAAERASRIAEIQRLRSAAFDQMDTNHDGQLSRSEFLAGGPAVPPAPDAAAVIGKRDTNHDGSLTYEEYAAPILAGFDQHQNAQANQNGR